jgi:RNA polymerase sigma factor (sigma-70 family)
MEDLDSLLARTQAGDLDAFGEVVARFQDMALGYAYSILGSFEDAQDAVQEAFIAAYGHLGDLRERERFAGWFRRIVLSACRAVARRRAPLIPLEEAAAAAPAASEPGRLAERAEMRRAVLSAVSALSPPNRTATVLFYIDGYSVDEVAEFLQVPAGTVKRRLHDSRKQIKEAMMDAFREDLQGRRLSPEFKREVLARISHWERFKATAEERLEMVEADPEWVRLTEFEIGLEPMSPACREIRKQIASMEPCHEHYVENVEAVVAMIAAMTPGRVLDCGEACPTRAEQARAYTNALERWLNGDAPPADADECTGEVFSLLGERTKAKAALVNHLVRKLRDNDYSVYADEDEDFDRTESRIQHLAICNYNWRENLRIVLREIAAGKRLFAWHAPGGYNAHGGCPDRTPQLSEMMAAVAAWANGKTKQAGRWRRVLGTATPEKRWLAGSLCKHVSAQHERHGGDHLLARPSP